MAIVHESFATNATTTLQTTITVAKPTGTVAGDLLYGVVNVVTNPLSAAPDGWVEIAYIQTPGGGADLYSYYKVAGASEPADYTWTLSAAQAATAGITRFSGVDTTTPLDVATPSTLSGASAASFSVPGITTVTAGAMLVLAIGVASGSVAITAPTEMTESWEAVGNRRTELDYEARATAGATGTRTFTLGAAREAAAIMTALRPASGAPATPQTVYATADVTDGLWLNEAGSNVNLFASIDEATASDTDYIESDQSPATASAVRLGFGSLSDPNVSTGHIIRYRLGKDADGGDALTVTARLYQGTTLIATDVTRTVPDAYTTYEWTLTAAEADAITNYGDLRIDFEAVKV